MPAVSVRQLDEALNAAAAGPTTANGLTVSVPPPVFVTVKCCVGAAVLSGVVGNVSDATDASTAGGGSAGTGAASWAHVPATAPATAQNCSCSMFRSVSVPSVTTTRAPPPPPTSPSPAPPPPTPAVCETVRDPSGLRVTV